MKDKNCTYSGVSIEDMPPERKELGKYIIKYCRSLNQA